jgi:hypothetical protein
VAVTNPAGQFDIALVPMKSQIEVLRIGYKPVAFTIEDIHPAVELQILLDRLPIELAPVVATAPAGVLGRSGFERRRRRGFGHFLTREQLEQRHGARLSDFLRDVPSIRLVRDTATGDWSFESRRAVSLGRGCKSHLYVDGVKLVMTPVDVLHPDEVEGIEVYRGPSETPVQFRGWGACGAVVVIWTRW